MAAAAAAVAPAEVLVRDRGLLESALARPRASAFGEDAYPDLLTKAAALLESLAGNHALIDGNEYVATAGDLVKLPMGIPHGLFNKSDQVLKCLFWVAPTRKLYELFWAIHSMKEQNPPDVVALSARYEINFLPPPA